MDGSSYPPHYNLVAAAVDYEQLGPSIVFAILDSLITKSSGDVPSLVTLASRAIMESAIADPVKSSEMKDFIEMNDCSAFISLLAGNCSATSQFIMRNLRVHHIPASNPAANTAQVMIHRSLTQIHFSGRSVYNSNYPTNKVPLERILLLSKAMFKRDFWMIGFLIDGEIPNVDSIIEGLKRVKEEAESPLEEVSSNRANFRICQYIYRERAAERRHMN